MASLEQRPVWHWLALALVGLGLCALIAGKELAFLWRAYYLALMTWWPVTTGALGLVALGNLTGGRWAMAARPFYLAAGKTLPLLALLFVPLAFGLPHIYSWAQTSEAAPHFIPSKTAYLSRDFFLARAGGYLVVWLFVGWWLNANARLDLPPGRTFAMRRAGALSLVLLVPTTTFAAFDWMMSLEPYWYSSIYGAIVTAGGVVATHALAILGLASITPEARRALLFTKAPPERAAARLLQVFNDLGNLLLAFIMVWGYFTFSQFLIIWSANLPSEITWYERRLSLGWNYMAIATVFICFVLPFMMLLLRDLKRNIGRLAVVATLLMLGYALYVYWTLAPALPTVPPAIHVANVGAMIGIGALWIALRTWFLARMRASRVGHGH